MLRILLLLFLPLMAKAGLKDLEQSIGVVMYEDSKGNLFKSTGFLVKPHIVLTCRHSVADDPKSNENVIGHRVKFYVGSPKKDTFKGLVVAAGATDSPSDDWAVIDLDQSTNGTALPVKIVDAKDIGDRWLMCLGYPKSSQSILLRVVQGELLENNDDQGNEIAKDGWQVDARLEEGFSGGPAMAVFDGKAVVIGINSKWATSEKTGKFMYGVVTPLVNIKYLAEKNIVK